MFSLTYCTKRQPRFATNGAQTWVKSSAGGGWAESRGEESANRRAHCQRMLRRSACIETRGLGGRFLNVRKIGKVVRSPEEAARRERKRELSQAGIDLQALRSLALRLGNQRKLRFDVSVRDAKSVNRSQFFSSLFCFRARANGSVTCRA